MYMRYFCFQQFPSTILNRTNSSYRPGKAAIKEMAFPDTAIDILSALHLVHVF